MPPGRPKTTNNEERLRARLADALHRLKVKTGINATRLAKEAGVTKQSMSLYLQGKATPTPETLRKLCTNLKLPPLDIEGAVISVSDIRPQKARPGPRNYQQLSLSLSEALLTVPQENIQVTVLKRGAKSIDLKVSVKFGAISSDLRRTKLRIAAVAG